MTAPLTNQSDFLAKVVHLGQLRPNVQAVIQNGLSKARESTLQSLAVVKNGAETFEQLALTSLNGGKAIAENLLNNAVDTTEVVFATAQKMATAKDVATAVRLQSELVEALISKSSEENKQLFKVVTQQAHSTLNGFRAAIETLPKA
jgi:Phasin protein